jgi:hypothetical protein
MTVLTTPENSAALLAAMAVGQKIESTAACTNRLSIPANLVFLAPAIL